VSRGEDGNGGEIGCGVVHVHAATHRYLDFLAAIEDPRPGLRALERIALAAHEGGRSYRGFNRFHGPDLDLFRTILRGEFTISGFQARQLRGHLAQLSGPQLSRCLKRLRTHGLIKKIGKRYKYYLTALGRTVATAARKLRELVVIPMLNQPVPAWHESLDRFAQDLTRKTLRRSVETAGTRRAPRHSLEPRSARLEPRSQSRTRNYCVTPMETRASIPVVTVSGGA
jgi:hypothetical protein